MESARKKNITYPLNLFKSRIKMEQKFYISRIPRTGSAIYEFYIPIVWGILHFKVHVYIRARQILRSIHSVPST